MSNDSVAAQYAVEVDGNKHSEYVYFADAIKVALVLRETHPQSQIKVRDLSEISFAEMKTDVAA